MDSMDRRKFLKLAGITAGTVAVYTFWPHGVIAQSEGGTKTVLAASTLSRPTFIAPAIVKRGDAIPFSKIEGAKATIESLWLQPAGKADVIALKENGAGESAATRPRLECTTCTRKSPRLKAHVSRGSRSP